MPWVIDELGESVWDDGNDAFRKWLDQYKVQRWGGEEYIDDGYDIPGVGKVTDAFPWADFQNYRPNDSVTPEAYRKEMFNNGQVIDTPAGKVFVGSANPNAQDMSRPNGREWIGAMLPGLLAGGVAAAGSAAGFGFGGFAGEGGLNALNSFDTGAMGEILGTGSNTVPSNYWNMLADAGGTMSDAGMEGMGDMVNTLGEGGIDFNAVNPASDPFSFTPDPTMPNLNMPTFGSPNALGLPEALGGSGAVLNGIENLASNAGGSWWDEILKGLDPKSPAMKTGASLLEWLSSMDNQRYQTNTMNDAANRADPFANERGFYQNLLRQSFSDPNFLQNNATFAGMRDVAVNDATRVAAGQGYNRSSNVLYDVADRVQKQGANYLNQFQGNVGQFAGAGINPATAANLQSNAAQLGVQANQSSNAARGNFLSSLPNLISSMKSGLA